MLNVEVVPAPVVPDGSGLAISAQEIPTDAGTKGHYSKHEQQR